MTTNSILLILFSIVIACSLSYFQYYFRVKSKSNVTMVLALLRFLTIFGILLLLINPVIIQKKLETIKTPLPIVVDNSSSIIALKAKETSLELIEKLTKNKDLQDKFEIQTYKFDTEFNASELIDFTGKQTNIDQVAKNLKSIYKNQNYPSVLISDGNQTTGNDYVFSFDDNQKIYPIVVGDTTKFLDLKVEKVNVNKYAFHKNKFPVEVFLHYSGNKNANADFTISVGNSILHKEKVSFSTSKKSHILNVLLPADKIGLNILKAKISSTEKEKNTYNNIKNFAVEVIDQKTNVALISSINHPDIGALKRAIESNAQRKVTIFKPNDFLNNQSKSLQDFSVLILYQPTNAFKSVFQNNLKDSKNTFIITGTQTDFGFLNQQQQDFDFKMSGQKEDFLCEFNTQFNLFASENLGFENLPPLQNCFGNIVAKTKVSILLSSKIRNVKTNFPLLAFAENQGKRSAFLFGENIWKWRLQSHLELQSFEKFDVFIDKIIQFLATNDSKKSLVVNHESFYNAGEAIEISAQYFNKNYEFDEKARLTVAIKNKKTKQTKNYDLLKSDSFFKVNLDGFEAGSYDFSIKELNSKSTYFSHFEIVDFDIEKQFVNPDVEKLSQLANQSKGKLFLPNQKNELIKLLLENETFKAIQKEIIERKPLIDWVWLLVFIAITLSVEWFLRKYHGMV